MEVAAQTVVSSVTVMVVAGMVYVPGVGHVVTKGVGTTGGVVAQMVERMVVVLEGGGGGGGGVEVEVEMAAGVVEGVVAGAA